MADFSPDSGAPAAPEVPSPEQGAPDAQQALPDSSPAGEGTNPEAEPQDPEEYRRSARSRIGELTFGMRRAERVAAEAIQENLALRQWIDMQQPRGPQQQAPQQPQQEGPPRQEDYSDWGEYMRAVAQHEYRTARAQDAQQAAAMQVMQQRAYAAAQVAHESRVREATLGQVVEQSAKKWADFEQVVSNPSLPSLRQVHPAVLDAVAYSEHGGDILYFLGKNPAEAVRIASMNPVHAVRELGKLEAKIAAGSVQFSDAPPPVGTVGARGASGADPLSDRSTIEAWMAARNRQVRKKGK